MSNEKLAVIKLETERLIFHSNHHSVFSEFNDKGIAIEDKVIDRIYLI